MAIITFFVFSFILVMLIRKSFDLLDAFVFLLPFKTLNTEIGLMVWAYYIPLILLLVKTTFIKKNHNVSNTKYFLLFVSYVALSTIIISTFFIPVWLKNLHGSFFREEGRFITSLIKFLFFQAGITICIYTLVRSKEKIFRLLNIYVWSVLFLSMIGLAQWIVFYITGINFLSSTIQNNIDKSEISEFVYNGIGFLRITSLGGEPKGLAASIAVAFSLIVISRRFEISQIKSNTLGIAILLLCLLLTLSTGGYGLIVIFIIAFYTISIIKKQFVIRFKPRTIIAIFVLVFSVAYFYNTIMTIINYRIIERKEILLTEDTDQAIQDFLINNSQWTIFGSGIGNIHNLAYKYISDKYLSDLMNGQIFVSRYGYIRLISESGITGLLLYLLFSITLFKKLNMFFRENEAKVLLYQSIIITCFYFARSGYVEAEMYFIFGLSLAYLNLQLKQRTNIALIRKINSKNHNNKNA